MVGSFQFANRAVVRFHVFAVQDVVDAKIEAVAVETDAHAGTAFDKGVFQIAFDGAPGVGNGGVVEIAADND